MAPVAHHFPDLAHVLPLLPALHWTHAPHPKRGDVDEAAAAAAFFLLVVVIVAVITLGLADAERSEGRRHRGERGAVVATPIATSKLDACVGAELAQLTLEFFGGNEDTVALTLCLFRVGSEGLRRCR